MSTARDYQPRYTVEDYKQWDGDWELWRGVAVSMSPSAFGPHASAQARLAAALIAAIDTAECDATVLMEIDWIIDRDTVVRPDLTIVCGKPPAGHVEDTPALAVEIVSPASVERDTIRKRALYQEETVPWYLIVDPETRSTTALRLDATGVYSEVREETELQIDICESCNLSVDLTSIFR
jgi:Uma2 family endonuclease